jgi:DNA-binding HxlR family transcriptional regulator
MVKRRKQDPRSQCPITNALDLIGDRWTMVLLRDLFTGKKRYSEFRASPEEISTNILADRLAMMEHSGLITSKPYQQRPLRLEYELTEKGTGLLPVLQELCRWGNKFLPGTFVPPASFMDRKVK